MYYESFIPLLIELVRGGQKLRPRVLFVAVKLAHVLRELCSTPNRTCRRRTKAPSPCPVFDKRVTRKGRKKSRKFRQGGDGGRLLKIY